MCFHLFALGDPVLGLKWTSHDLDTWQPRSQWQHGLHVGHLSAAAEPNCVVVLGKRRVGLCWIFMVAAGGKSSVLNLRETPWI